MQTKRSNLCAALRLYACGQGTWWHLSHRSGLHYASSLRVISLHGITLSIWNTKFRYGSWKGRVSALVRLSTIFLMSRLNREPVAKSSFLYRAKRKSRFPLVVLSNSFSCVVWESYGKDRWYERNEWLCYKNVPGNLDWGSDLELGKKFGKLKTIFSRHLRRHYIVKSCILAKCSITLHFPELSKQFTQYSYALQCGFHLQQVQ